MSRRGAAMIPADLPHRLAAELAERPPGALAVAFSGGLDSTVLLHALAGLPAARARGLRALHVDHGLQPPSGAWATHCVAFARALDLDCRVLDAHVARDGRGLEDAARQARYGALAQELGAGETLVLAQHRDDQAETILLKLLRAARMPPSPSGPAPRSSLSRMVSAWSSRCWASTSVSPAPRSCASAP